MSNCKTLHTIDEVMRLIDELEEQKTIYKHQLVKEMNFLEPHERSELLACNPDPSGKRDKRTLCVPQPYGKAYKYINNSKYKKNLKPYPSHINWLSRQQDLGYDCEYVQRNLIDWA